MQISTSVGVVHAIFASLCSWNGFSIGCIVLGHKHRQAAAGQYQEYKPNNNMDALEKHGIEFGLRRELVPSAAMIAVLFSPTSPNSTETTRKELEGGARVLRKIFPV